MNNTTTFSIEYKQYLDQDGNAITELPAIARDHEQLKKLYKDMLRLRLFDAKTVTLQRTGKMGTYPSSLGQEAVAVTIGNALEKQDVFCPSYREQGALFARGTSMSEILTYWGGDERGSDFQANRNDLPICVPIATQCLHAVGVAYAMKLRQQQQAVLTIVGDGGSSKGDFLEALNVAGAWQLPIVFIICNNQWAISVPRKMQSATTMLAQKAIGAGITGIQIDGNDLIALHETIHSALATARTNNKPCLIEAITYRLCDHTTADDANRYRDDEEVKQAWQAEPIKRMKQYLEQQASWDEAQDQALLAECQQEVADAVDAYLAMPVQAAESMFDYLYASLPESLQEQRAEVIAFARGNTNA